MVIDSGAGWTICGVEKTVRRGDTSCSTGAGTCPDGAAELGEHKAASCAHVRLRLCQARLCGLVSGDGRVVRYEVSSAQFGCGSEHNESG